MTRWLTESCPTCGDRKEMYGRAICFKCESPDEKKVITIDFLAACRRVERKYDFNPDQLEGPSRKWWEILIEYDWVKNDAWVWIPIVGMIDEPGSWGPDFSKEDVADKYEEVIKFIEAFIEEFALRDREVYWHLSY